MRMNSAACILCGPGDVDERSVLALLSLVASVGLSFVRHHCRHIVSILLVTYIHLHALHCAISPDCPLLHMVLPRLSS